MLKIFISLLIVISVTSINAQKDSSITLSEIMFYPSSSIPNGEFIEIFNKSLTDTINIKNWKIRYYTSNPDVIIPAGNDSLLLPGKFAVIFEGDYTSGYDIPEGVLKLKISDNSFGTSGMSNTESREVRLINPKGDTISVYVYTANNQAGYSDEKIILNGNNNSSNWSNSQILNGTPGKTNSVSPKMFDIRLLEINTSPSIIKYGDNANVSCKIRNYGTEKAVLFSVNFYYDTNNDLIPDVEVPPILIGELLPDELLTVNSTVQVQNINSIFNIYCKVFFQNDEDTTNNFLTKKIEPLPSGVSVVINEIMFSPVNDEPEWIELYNNSDYTLNVKNWSVSDLSSRIVITTNDFLFKPKSYLILSDNSSINNYYDTIPCSVINLNLPALNNDKDAIVISNDKMISIDSVYYFGSWGIAGQSLERYSADINSNDPKNWMANVTAIKGSPGKINSISDLKDINKSAIIINEIMYEPITLLSEYIELKNISLDTINLSGCKLNLNSNKIALNQTKLPPNNLLLILSDSSNFQYFKHLKIQNELCKIIVTNQSSLGLTNDAGNISFYSPFNTLIDSLYYSKKFHNPLLSETKGRSLERISPFLETNQKDNWSSSTNPLGGTPGLENSLLTNIKGPSSSLEIFPNPFSPDFDGFEDNTIFSYKLNFSSGYMRIKIFDSRGRLVKIFIDNEFTGPEGSFVYNGLDENNNPLRIGIYIALMEATNKITGESQTIKKAFVVARKL